MDTRTDLVIGRSGVSPNLGFRAAERRLNELSESGVLEVFNFVPHLPCERSAEYKTVVVL